MATQPNALPQARALHPEAAGQTASDISDEDDDDKEDYTPYLESRDSLVGGGDDHDVARRFLVTKDKPLFGTSATAKYLEVLRSGRVRIRDAKRSRLDTEIMRPNADFESVPGSMKAKLEHMGKTRHFKFSTSDEKDKFFECLRQMGRKSERRARKHRHSVKVFEYVPNEIPIMFLKNVKVERQGSLVKHSGLLAITNYRIVVIESNGTENGASALRPGDKSIVALECPHLCVDSLDMFQDTIQIHTKDLRTLLIDLNALQQPKLKGHCVDTLRRQTACQVEGDVFAFQAYLDAVRARTPKTSEAETPGSSGSPRATFPLGIGSMSDLSKLFTPDHKEVVYAQLSEDRYPEGHIDEVMKREYARWLGPTTGCPFRISDVNVDYELCPTYPRYLVVPRTVDDTYLRRAAPFRSRSRLPAIVWSNESRVTMSRCSQTTSGMGRRNEFDEGVIQSLNQTNPNSESYVICDCRPKVNAMANKYIKGKGYEGDSYAQCHIMFFDIENIHVMRASLLALKRCCENQFSENWLGNLNQTRWMLHSTRILNCSRQIANMIDKDKYSVLVHCSDGWDRTAQVCSLGQLFLDPHYRSLEGFLVLIQKEWIYFGHKLADRCGTFGEDGVAQGRRAREERSPVFLQFLDCVFQVMHQFPWAFEFTSDLLLEIWEHVNSGRFGDFFFNCQRERDEHETWLKTPSLFKYLHSLWDHGRFRNPTYYPTQSVLKPRHNVRDMVLWDDLYCRYTSHDKDRRIASNIMASSLYRRHSYSEDATPSQTPRTPGVSSAFRNVPTPTSRRQPGPPPMAIRTPSPEQPPLDGRSTSNTTISRPRKGREKRWDTMPTNIQLPESVRNRVQRSREQQSHPSSHADVPSPPPRANGSFNDDSSSDSEDITAPPPDFLTIKRLQNEILDLKAVIRRYREGDTRSADAHEPLFADDPDTYHTDGVIGNIV